MKIGVTTINQDQHLTSKIPVAVFARARGNLYPFPLAMRGTINYNSPVTTPTGREYITDLSIYGKVALMAGKEIMFDGETVPMGGGLVDRPGLDYWIGARTNGDVEAGRDACFTGWRWTRNMLKAVKKAAPNVKVYLFAAKPGWTGIDRKVVEADPNLVRQERIFRACEMSIVGSMTETFVIDSYPVSTMDDWHDTLDTKMCQLDQSEFAISDGLVLVSLQFESTKQYIGRQAVLAMAGEIERRCLKMVVFNPPDSPEAWSDLIAATELWT